MASIFDLTSDVILTYDGDIAIDDDQDISSINGIEWFKREINKIIRTHIGEWRSEPGIGICLNDYVGESNTKDTADDIRDKILSAITIDGLGSPGQFDIRVIPTSINNITIYISYTIAGDTYNIAKMIFELDKGLSVPIFDEYDESTINKITNHRSNKSNKYIAGRI